MDQGADVIVQLYRRSANRWLAAEKRGNWGVGQASDMKPIWGPKAPPVVKWSRLGSGTTCDHCGKSQWAGNMGVR